MRGWQLARLSRLRAEWLIHPPKLGRGSAAGATARVLRSAARIPTSLLGAPGRRGNTASRGGPPPSDHSPSSRVRRRCVALAADGSSRVKMAGLGLAGFGPENQIGSPKENRGRWRRCPSEPERLDADSGQVLGDPPRVSESFVRPPCDHVSGTPVETWLDWHIGKWPYCQSWSLCDSQPAWRRTDRIGTSTSGARHEGDVSCRVRRSCLPRQGFAASGCAGTAWMRRSPEPTPMGTAASMLAITETLRRCVANNPDFVSLRETGRCRLGAWPPAQHPEPCSQPDARRRHSRLQSAHVRNERAGFRPACQHLGQCHWGGPRGTPGGQAVGRLGTHCALPRAMCLHSRWQGNTTWELR